MNDRHVSAVPAWLVQRVIDVYRRSDLRGAGIVSRVGHLERWRAPVVLIDGQSGAGKTVLTQGLADACETAGIRGLQVIHLDQFYPGWGGLNEGTRILEQLLCGPPSTPAGFRLWDWANGRWGAFVQLDPRRPLLVEGSGALTPQTKRAADLTIWVELAQASYAENLHAETLDAGAKNLGTHRAGADYADANHTGAECADSDCADAERKRRALARDGDMYRPWWDMWAAQEQAHVSQNRPDQLADLVVQR